MKKILFVCTMNLQRSRTAEDIYKTDQRFHTKSAGTYKHANHRINQEDLNWADVIIVMERHHRNKIRKEFPTIYNTKRIICLYIEDEYDYMETASIELLKFRFEKVYQSIVKSQ